MKDAIQLGFMAILLALLMYFAFLSFQKGESGLNVSTSSLCPTVCCRTGCNTHKIEVLDAQTVRFAHSLLTPDEFANHLLLAHYECDVQLVSIWAASDIKHEAVLTISNVVQKNVPNAVVSWNEIDY